MSDGTREFRVVDRDGQEWFRATAAACIDTREDADLMVVALGRDWPGYGPFTVESRTVTDWLSVETRQPADSATGCQTTEATAP